MVPPVDDGKNLSNTKTVELYQQRLLVCLDRANMTSYFIQEGLLDTALDNVKYTVDTIRQFIPTSFSKQFHCSCWKSDFGLTIENSTVQGHFGQFTFQGNNALKLLALQKFKFRVGGNYSTHFSCLPEVFLAGFPKCGSTFLHALLTSHPAVVESLVKEPHWWERAMSFNQSKVEVAVRLSNYLINFAPLVRRLDLVHELHVLSVDATPSLMFDWPKFPHQDWRTNFCLLPTVLPSVVQNSKFIVVMRNPVSMLYSAFWHSCTRHKQTVLPEIQVRGPSIFHERVKTKVLDFNSCMEHFPLAKCVMDAKPELYTSKLPHCGRTRLDFGVYFVHVQKWLSVVSKEKFLFLTLEELSSQTEKVAKQIWRFLNVTVSAKTFQRAMHRSHRNQRGSFRVLMIHYRNLSVSRKAIAKCSGRALMHPRTLHEV